MWFGLHTRLHVCVLLAKIKKIKGSVWHLLIVQYLIVVWGGPSINKWKRDIHEVQILVTSAQSFHIPDLRRVYCKAYVHTRAVQKTTWQSCWGAGRKNGLHTDVVKFSSQTMSHKYPKSWRYVGDMFGE